MQIKSIPRCAIYGFICNFAVKNTKGEVTDIELDYSEGYAEQMLRYSRDYSFLPTDNN